MTLSGRSPSPGEHEVCLRSLASTTTAGGRCREKSAIAFAESQFAYTQKDAIGSSTGSFSWARQVDEATLGLPRPLRWVLGESGDGRALARYS